MKKLLKYLMLLITGIILAACSNGEGTADDGNYIIGYAINNLNDTGQTIALNAAEDRAEEAGIEIRVENAEEDLISQQDQVNTLIQNDVDALIVVPVDTSAMEPIIEAAQNANTPLVFVNRNPFFGKGEDLPENVYYVGSTEIEAGYMQAEHAIELLGEEGNGAVLMGLLGSEGAEQRTAGVNEIFDEYPGMELLAEETAEWQRDLAINISENWILTYGDELDVIFANNDEMAFGALQAIESTGRDDIIVIGLDGIPQAVDSVKSGDMDATIFQNLAGQGDTAVSVIEGLKDGVEPEEQIQMIDFELITSENASDYE